MTLENENGAMGWGWRSRDGSVANCGGVGVGEGGWSKIEVKAKGDDVDRGKSGDVNGE